MSIIAINVNTTGLVGESVNPRRCSMVSTDNLATITAAGYLNNQNTGGNPILPTDIFEVIYGYNISTKQGTFGIFQVSYASATGYSLVEWTNPANVLLPVVSGDVAIFNGTSGQISDSGILATNMVVKNAVNQMAAAGEILLDKGTGTVSAGAVTINKQSGVITGTFSTAAAASTTVTFNNSEIASTSVILVSLMGGTNTIPGVQLSCSYTSAGVATLTVTNNNVAGSALSGTLIIGFAVL
jgi:hypothetical protein